MEQKTLQNRASLLADVAEMYYLEEKNQAEIAKTVGVTRSMVSRMMTEARESGIVDIRIQRPLQSEPELESALKDKFEMKDVFVVVTSYRSVERLTRTLGNAGAKMLARDLRTHHKHGHRLSLLAVMDCAQTVETQHWDDHSETTRILQSQSITHCSGQRTPS